MKPLNISARYNKPRSKAKLAPLIIIFALFCLLIGACVNVQYPVQKPFYSSKYVTENQTQLVEEIVPIYTSNSSELALTPYVVWSNPQLRFKENQSIWYYGYHLPNPQDGEQIKIKITFFRQRFYQNISASVFDMGPRGQILAPPLLSVSDNTSIKPPSLAWITSTGDISTFNTWMNMANLKLDFARFLGGKTDLFLNSEEASPIELDMRGCVDIALLISGTKQPQNCRFVVSMVRIETITENITRSLEHTVEVQAEQKQLEQITTLETKQVPFWEYLIPK